MIKRAVLREQLSSALERYEKANGALPGISQPECRAAFVEQLVESVRRTLYFEHVRTRAWDPSVADPASDAFNPLRAAVRRKGAGQRDEAFWLVFLYVHFGKHLRSEWRLIADVYGRLGDGTLWSWEAVTADVNGFRRWLDDSIESIRSLRPRRGFGNHRKYESLDAWSDSGTGAVVASYVTWVGVAGHDARVEQIIEPAATSAQRFELLYDAVQRVRRFGRTAAFDYCSALARLGFGDLEPSAACLSGATGPLIGARLLLAPGQSVSVPALEAMLVPLREELEVGFDAVEDALCNWQKSPAEFRPFRG